MHSRVGRQRQASQNSGTVIAASGGRVVARDVLNSVSGCSRPIFSSERCPPEIVAHVVANVAPPTAASLDALPRSPSVAPAFSSLGRGRVRRRPSQPTAGPLNLVVPVSSWFCGVTPDFPSQNAAPIAVAPSSLFPFSGSRASLVSRVPSFNFLPASPDSQSECFPSGRAARESPPVPGGVGDACPPDFVAQ